MLPMPRPRYPYVQRQVTRHGKTLWYFRRGKGARFPLGDRYGSPEFMKAYEAALGGERLPPPPKASQATLKWLVERYTDSAAFLTLAPSTQLMRKNILLAACRNGGDLKISDIDRTKIAAGRDRRAATPFAAINFMKVMNYLFSWAVDAGLATDNPLIGVKRPKARTRGHKPWTIEDLNRYCDRHPVGTKAHLAVSLFLFTGVRRGDVIHLGRQHIRNGVIEYQANKNDAPLFIVIPPPLALSIELATVGDMIFLTTAWKQRLSSRRHPSATGSATAARKQASTCARMGCGSWRRPSSPTTRDQRSSWRRSLGGDRAGNRPSTPRRRTLGSWHNRPL
jgi:integrase